MNNNLKKPPLRLAFIGGGVNSAVGRAHFDACRMDGKFELFAGCFSRNEDINHESAAAYGVAATHVHASVDTLLEHEGRHLDAVVVLTPTPVHKEAVLRALGADVPVICEKALVSTIEDAATVRDAAQRAGKFLVVSYNYTGYPMLRELRAIVAAGRLGKLLHLSAEMPQEGFVRRDAHGNPFKIQSWRLKDGPIPGVHLDLGVHLHQIVHYLTGLEPECIYAQQASLGAFRDVVDYVNAAVEFRGGVRGAYTFGKSSLGYRNGLRIRLYGENASAEWVQTDPEQLRICRVDGATEIVDRGGSVQIAGDSRYTRFKAGHPAGYVEAFANVYGDIHDCLRAFKSTGQWQSDEIFGPELAYSGLQFLQAMANSARKNERMPL